MADVKILNGYNIKDAYALRNKSTTAAYSFVDTRAGTTSYPTTGASLSECNIIGDASYVIPASATGITILGRSSYASAGAATVIGNYAKAGMQSVSIGNSSGNTNSYTVNIGCNSTNSGNESVAVGETSFAAAYSTAVGRNAQATNSYTTALGNNAYATASYSVALGTSVAARYQHSISIGYGANASNSNAVSIGSYAQANYYSVAIGRNSYANSLFSVQLGNGTNNNYGSLQFRDWPLVNGNGKIYEERLPDGLRTATPRFPNLYDIDEEKISEQSILYTGPENDSYKNSQFYRGRVRYGYPRFYCGWADTDWLDSNTDVMIDQQKLFIKLAEITKQRIDDDDIENGLIGGDNAEQSIYLYYDADNDYYLLRFDSDSFEKAFNGTPDDITGLSFDDLADYGIYFRNFHKPEDLEGEYEFCDIYYYAPVYIDGYDWNANPSYVNYFKFLEAMNDSDWGIGYVIPDYESWIFTVDGETYDCPIIPKTYEWDGSEYDNVEFRWEWSGTDWTQYINGEDIDRSWSTAEMYTTFGIKIEPGEEENIEYIGLYVRGGDQRYWKQFDPVDANHFASKTEFNNLQGQVNVIDNYKCFQRRQTSTDLNTLTTYGAYKIEHTYTNGPAIATPTSPNTVSFVFVTSTPGTIRQVLIPGVITTNDGYRRYYPPMFYRCYTNGAWTSWYEMLSTSGENISGYDSNATQYLTHSSAGAMTWGAGGGSSYTAGDGIDITNDTISVDDLDCGTM